MACPVTTKWKVVGKMDTAPWVWVIVAVVVVVLIVLLLLAGGRRRKAMQEKRDQEHREKAAEIRREAENMEIDAREREAKAIRARADAEQAQVDAARLKKEAEQRSQEAQSLRGDIASHTRKADEIDPDAGREGDRRRDIPAGRDAGFADSGHPGGQVNAGHSDVGPGRGALHDASAPGANADGNAQVPEDETRRRRHADRGDTSTGEDARGEGNPRI